MKVSYCKKSLPSLMNMLYHSISEMNKDDKNKDDTMSLSITYDKLSVISDIEGSLSLEEHLSNFVIQGLNTLIDVLEAPIQVIDYRYVKILETVLEKGRPKTTMETINDCLHVWENVLGFSSPPEHDPARVFFLEEMIYKGHSSKIPSAMVLDSTEREYIELVIASMEIIESGSTTKKKVSNLLKLFSDNPGGKKSQMVDALCRLKQRDGKDLDLDSDIEALVTIRWNSYFEENDESLVYCIDIPREIAEDELSDEDDEGSRSLEYMNSVAATLRQLLVDWIPVYAVTNTVYSRNESTVILSDMLQQFTCLPFENLEDGVQLQLFKHNNTTDKVVVTTDDIHYPYDSMKLFSSKLERSRNVYLAVLPPGKSINMIFTTGKGNGKMNSKFQSVCCCNLQEYYDNETKEPRVNVTFESVGQYTVEDIIRLSVQNLENLKLLKIDPFMDNSIVPDEYHYMFMEDCNLDASNQLSVYSDNLVTDPANLDTLDELKTIYGEMGGSSKENTDVVSPYNKIDVVGKTNNYFLNRAAPKIVEIIFQMRILEDLKDSGDTITVADIAAGPGGWSDSVLQWFYRQGVEDCEVFGYTLQSKENLFKEKLFLQHPDYDEFRDYYLGKFSDISKEIMGGGKEGDVTDVGNIEGLHKFFRKRKTQMDLVMSDGGDIVKESNISEIHNLSLIAGEAACALGILKMGGCFVCKLFMTITPQMLWLMYTVAKSFKKIRICKPVASKPTNSEAYLVCLDFQGDPKLRELYECTQVSQKLKSAEYRSWEESIMSTEIPIRFANYVKDTNDLRLKQQIYYMHNVVYSTNIIPEEDAIATQTAFYNLWGLGYASKKEDTELDMQVEEDEEDDD